MNMKKGEMIAVMSKHDIEILNPTPIKLVLLGKILIILKNIEKQYVINCMIGKAPCSVLRLSPHIESHRIRMESIKISRWRHECLYK